VLFEVVDGTLEVVEEESGEIAAETEASQHTLDDQVGAVLGHGVGRDLPSAKAQAVGEIVQGEIGVGAVLQRPGAAWDAAATVVNDFEDVELVELLGQPDADLFAAVGDLGVSAAAEADEVVVLGGNLSAGTGEVEGEGGHVSAEVFHVEDQLFGEVLGVAPDGPSAAERRQAELVAGGVDGLDARQAEIPDDRRMDEGGNEASAGTIDVDGDVETLALLEVVEGLDDVFDGFVDEGVGEAERGDDTDSVLVTALEDFVGGHHESRAFAGDLAHFDVEVAAELVPADLYRAADEIGTGNVFAFGAAKVAPACPHGEAAEHGGFAGACGGAADGSGGVGRVPEIGNHVNAAGFELRHLRILFLVDHVLVDALVHELADFGLEPGLAEGGDVLPGVAVEQELVVHELISRGRVSLVLWHLVFG